MFKRYLPFTKEKNSFYSTQLLKNYLRSNTKLIKRWLFVFSLLFYSGIFYSCQFIISFRPFHSFWEEEDLSRRSIQAFQNDTIIISWLYLTVQWHSFKTFMFVFITSSSSQKLFCQEPNQYRSLMTFRNKIQAETFTWPDMLFYAR